MEFVILIVILIFSAILHEVSHGVAALRLGDPTAKLAGRLTLNPLKHLDPFGSLLLPALLVIVRSPILFAYAKPVPINPNFFKSFRMGTMLTAAAGPLTNLAIASVFALAMKGILLTGGSIDSLPVLLFFLVILVNIVLMTFNLIPIPPLDGSKVLGYFFPYLISPQAERFGALLLFPLIILLSPVIGTLFAAVLSAFFAIFGLTEAFTALAGSIF